MPYAEHTTTPVGRSRDEVYRLLARYGATEHLLGGDDRRILCGFVLRGRHIRIERPLPRRSDYASDAAFERETRRQWRVLILLLKGRLEIVAEGAESVDQAFAAYLMLPDGSVAGERITGFVDTYYRTGEMPESLLPGLPPAPKVIELPSRTGT